MTLAGWIERRILVNYRVDPEVAASLLPAPFRPHLVDGSAVAGICLLRLGAMRPAGLPAVVGRRSENAAHRIAVEWDSAAGPQVGVYIPRRDTGSALNVAVGGRLFPGVHHRADFAVTETDDDLQVGFGAHDGSAAVDVDVQVGRAPYRTGLFPSLDAASAFFRAGFRGWSATGDPASFDGLALHTDAWSIEPAVVRSVRSSFFDALPPGSCTLDGALVMRDVPVRWRPMPALSAASGRGPVGRVAASGQSVGQA